MAFTTQGATSRTTGVVHVVPLQQLVRELMRAAGHAMPVRVRAGRALACCAGRLHEDAAAGTAQLPVRCAQDQTTPTTVPPGGHGGRARWVPYVTP